MPLTRITSNVIENGTIIDADIAANAAISMSKIQTYSASTKTFYLAPRTDGIAGDGTITNPYDVSTPAKWKSVFLAIPSYSTVRLLSGQYNIQHSNYQEAPYYPAGISIIGDGIGKTIITGTLAPATNPSGSQWYLIAIDGERDGNGGNPYATMPRQKSCVVSDMTIDCNWQNLRVVNSKCQAVSISGTENNVIRRVRAINFGGHWATGNESFPIACDGDNSIIEECVVEQPVAGVGETDVYATYLASGGGLATWQQTIRSISSDATNNTINQQQRYSLNDIFVFETLTGGNPLVTGKKYYVVNPTNNGNTFQLSETFGGSAIDFDAISSATGGGLKTENKCIIRNNICRGQSTSIRDGFGAILGSGYSQIIIEGNTFENLSQGCYGDSWTNGTAIIKNNFFNNCRRCIASANAILSTFPLTDQIIIKDNVFYGYGANGSVYPSPNGNSLGGWAVRISNQVTNVTFTGNRIKSVDGLPINEVLFFAPLKLTYTDNIIDENCGIANLPAGTLAIVENNTDERGIQRFDFANWSGSYTVKCSSAQRYSFTADAATNIITVPYSFENFAENDFVYFYNLTGGVGLSENTRYYIRNVKYGMQQNYNTTFQLYTEKTGGTLVDITTNYTSSQNKISNREFKNGVAITRAINYAKYAIYDVPTQPFTVFVEPGIYEYNGASDQNPTSSLPPGWKIVGLGKNTDVILRNWKETAMALFYGNASGVSVINLTLTAWGVGGTAFVGGSGNYFEDVIFAMGGGAIKCFGNGSIGVGNQTTMIRCSSSDRCDNIDSLPDQGTATNGLYVDCNFSNGFPPQLGGSIVRNCNFKAQYLAFRNNGGILQNSRIEILGAYALNALDLYNGAKCEDSIIEGFRVRVGGTTPTINNTTINTSDPTDSIIQQEGATTVNIFNVGANKPIGAGVTKATPLTAL